MHVAGAVTKAVEKLPADRFETAKAFRDALEDPSFRFTHTTAAALRARSRLARTFAELGRAD
jgi:serine/threonine-protein kinase